MNAKNPYVSVIIPVYNDSGRIGKTINALLQQDYPEELYEIIVVDNGSTDNSKSIVSSFPVKLIEESTCKGSYAARNKGLSVAKGKIIAFTDSDCVPSQGWIKAGVHALKKYCADIAAGHVAFNFSPVKTASEYYDAVMNIQNEEAVRERGVGNTANLFIKRKIFESIGYFPKGIYSGGDVYFTAKASTSGFSIIYASDAIVTHPTRSFFDLLKKAFRVGKGKSEIMKVYGNTITSNWKRKKQKTLDYINPKIMFHKLNNKGFSISIMKQIQILLIFYIILFVTFVGRVYGKQSILK